MATVLTGLGLFISPFLILILINGIKEDTEGKKKHKRTYKVIYTSDWNECYHIARRAEFDSVLKN